MLNRNPVQKRGGMRKALRKRPVKVVTANTLFTNKESPFNKKLTDYKYVISTNFTADELCSLILFTGWVKTNEKTLDAHSNFPIYAIITSEEKKETAITFLQLFADILGWNDQSVDLYSQYNSSLKRVWTFGEEKIELSAFNFVYLNFANHPLGYPFNLSFENRDLV